MVDRLGRFPELCLQSALPVFQFFHPVLADVRRQVGAFNMLDKPIRFINIEFDGVATILMSYLSAGEPEIGMKVVPIFRTSGPTFTILDLSWVPEGTDQSRLPEGFSF